MTVPKKPVAAKPATARPAATKPATPRATAAKTAAPAAAPEYNFTKPYKMLTGADDGEFCSKVSAHLNAGYVLVGGGALTVIGGKAIVGQAVYKASNIAKKPAAKKKKKK